MSVSYSKLLNLLTKRGLSVNYLYEKDVITDNAAQNIRKGNPVRLNHIDSICQYLNVPIEQVVEIIPDEETSE